MTHSFSFIHVAVLELACTFDICY